MILSFSIPRSLCLLANLQLRDNVRISSNLKVWGKEGDRPRERDSRRRAGEKKGERSVTFWSGKKAQVAM